MTAKTAKKKTTTATTGAIVALTIAGAAGAAYAYRRLDADRRSQGKDPLISAIGRHAKTHFQTVEEKLRPNSEEAPAAAEAS